MVTRQRAHDRFLDRLAFILNNPIRRRLSPPASRISKLTIGPKYAVVGLGREPGFFLAPLAKTAGRAIGIDVSARMLERAAEHAEKNKVDVELLESNGNGSDWRVILWI